MNRAVLASLVLGLFALCSGLQGADAAPTAPAAATPAPLSLEECVRRALSRNFSIEIDRYNPANARESLQIAQSGFDPTFGLSSSIGGVRGTTSGIASVNRGLNTQATVTQRLATGATITLGTALDRTATGGGVFAGYNPSYFSDMSLTLRQPLLSGAGLTVNRAAIHRARLGVDVAGSNFSGTAMDVVRNTEVAYYQLSFARQQLEVRRLSLASAQRLYDENTIKRDTGVLTDLDVVAAEVGVANQRRNLLLADQQMHDSEDSLKALIGQFELDAAVGATAFADPATDVLSVEATFARAKAAQPEYLAAQTTVEQLRIDAVTAKNARLPSLDLTSTLGYNATQGSAGDALREAPGSDNYNWQVGLALTYPWGQRGDRARYHLATNTLNRELARLRQIEQNLLVEARSSVRAIETNRQAVEVSALASRLSARQYELEKAKFDVGSSTARLVLDAQTDLDNARVNEISAKVALLNSLANLRRLEGRTLDTYGIKLQP